jgi:hypothetical protein
MAGSSDDELARTATAAGSTTTPGQAQAAVVAGTLGRYRIERRLGEGGMGVVHAAFDPDLERRVALKVLRAEAEAAEARQRLLREARAMARLAHPNVVAVHEVGSAGGRDYVAMELVEGETLADWLRTKRHTADEIVQAFVAAGRGLAAAHAAGLVHRDFKPHNVLRGHDGRICVTDFGLARGVEDVTAALEATMPLQGGVAKPANTPSPLSGLTATGSVLGTPAYMAPEQWRGGTIGPAADQFAFCVGLWEALTGERPFRGTTIEELKRAVDAGPRALDASKLPRRLRRPLRRGLDPDPSKRLPSMDALIAAIARPARPRRWLRLGLWPRILIAALGTAVFVYDQLGAKNPVSSCAAPAIEPDTVWSAARGIALAASGRADVSQAFARDVTAWQGARDAACRQPPEQAAPKLACLDGVLARLSAVGRAVDRVSGDVLIDGVLDQLVDPHVCEAALSPRLTLRPSDAVISAVAFALQADRNDKPKPDAVESFTNRPGLEPCARGVASLVVAGLLEDEDLAARRAAFASAIADAETCGDDRLRAEALIEAAPMEFEVPTPGAKAKAAVERAKAAANRIDQPDLVARAELRGISLALQDKHWNEALAAVDRGVAAMTARGYVRRVAEALGRKVDVYLARRADGDMSAALAVIDKARPLMAASHDEHALRDLDTAEGGARWADGDVAGGHAVLVRSWSPNRTHFIQTQALDGVVVDAKGGPVAGVTVAVAVEVLVDSLGVLPLDRHTLRMTTTDARGAFTIADAPVNGGIVAWTPGMVASQRIAPQVRLVLAPMRRISGQVELHGASRAATIVFAADQTRWTLYVSPVARDGSYSVTAPSGAIKIGTSHELNTDNASMASVPVAPGTTRIDGLRLEAPTGGRTLEVIVRSEVAAPLDNAQVLVFAGKHVVRSVKELRRLLLDDMQVAFAKPISGDALLPVVRDTTKPGDLLAHFTQVRDGELSACAVGLQGDLRDPTVARALNAHVDELEVRCATASASDQVVVVVVPPQKRFD